MRRKIPSTAALTAFDAAARHESFTKAADELALSQSAICRQIATLEDFLGTKLFRRAARGVVLTEAGASYSRSVAARLDEVERDTLELMASGGWIAPVIDWTPLIAYFIAIGGDDEEVQTVEWQAQG